MCTTFDDEEMVNIFSSIKNKSSDLTTYQIILLKNAKNDLVKPITCIPIFSLDTGTFPNVLKFRNLFHSTIRSKVISWIIIDQYN